ncbi:glutamyl-tRNA synthetase [Synechococcus sp. BIOS-U3-1]|uniref:glutamate--tRNA ligase n=1 Tax=Synechococcus sp. BIOS-U3-1 TaxID=1400865 RepID=UPI0016480C1B|nr:glutamate--tRNA ligase [Synechococcus sp. BIOS-U3-1]QNI59383.1 glutamyl-tRNA synthetase [Synechococcus sp. BIOS-U3-1]
MVRVRLAPSPTGTLHIGTARTAVFNWLFARHQKGQFLLRIEDTDKERSKPEFTTNILDGLAWLGIDWDEDPTIQSERVHEHRSAIQLLLDRGLAYRCYANEEELAAMRELQKAENKAPRYDNRHRHLTAEQEASFKAEGREAVIRFRIDDSEEIHWRDLVRGPMQWRGADLGGDMVIARRAPNDQIGDPLYNLVVVVDDAAMDITHVIRGEDHIANTAKQLLLYQALELTAPVFAHTPLILNAEGRKLSKRDGVTSINDFRSMGYTAEAIANYMTLLGWSVPEGMEERFTLTQAAEVFSFDRVNKAGARFDWDKLNWLNAQVLHGLTPQQLLNEISPLWREQGWSLPEDVSWSLALCELLGPSLTLLKDGIDQAQPFFVCPELEDDGLKQLELEGARGAIGQLVESLESDPWDGGDIAEAQSLLAGAANKAGVKKGVLMKSLRAGLLGRLQGPDLITTWSLLARVGQDLPRLKRCLT